MTIHPYYLNTLTRHVRDVTDRQTDWNKQHEAASNSSIWFWATVLALGAVSALALLPGAFP